MKIVAYNSFGDLPDSVKRANEYPSQCNFLLSNQWFELLFNNTLGSSLVLRVYVAYTSDNEVVSILYCGSRKHEKILVGLTNFYSLEYSPVVISQKIEEVDAIDPIIKYIASERPRWNIVDLRFLTHKNTFYNQLCTSFKQAGFYTKGFYQYENWTCNVRENSFQEYYDQRPSKLKNTIKRKGNKINDQIKIRVHTEDTSELTEAINHYTTVYNNSWKKNEPYATFIPSLIKLSAQHNVLLLGILYLKEKPVAAQLWLVTKDRAIIYKLAYDENYKKLSVGSILSKRLFEIVIDQYKISTIDYGIGSEPYKKEWMSDSSQIWGINALNKKTIKGYLLMFIDKIKNWYKS